MSPPEPQIPDSARAADTAPDFSVIVACFNEAETIEEFHRRLGAALEGIPARVDIVYVNDGSTDDTLARLEALFHRDPRVGALLDLAVNVGQNVAQSAGIAQAAGRDLILIDCDLQTDPADLRPLVEAFRQGCDMASGLRARRRDHPFRRFLSYLGNRLISRILHLPVRDLGSGMKVVNGALIRALGIGPHRPFDAGEAILCLRSVIEVPIAHHPRRTGRSRWTTRRALMLYHSVVTNLLPVVFPVFLMAICAMLLALLAALAAAWAAPGFFPAARDPLFISTLLGVHLLLSVALLWLIAEFTLRTRGRAAAPAYIVRRLWSRPAPPPEKESQP